MLHLYNNLTRRKELFSPLTPGAVRLYTCGPTVYDFQHIGNIRAYMVWDVLKRYLVLRGFKVNHIMNITDVGHLTSDADSGEDKMEVAKKRERATAWDVAEKYFGHFKEDCAKLNILPPSKYVRATDHIADMIAFVQSLEKGGFLYTTSDGLYFDTSKDSEYGNLGMIRAKNLRSGARVEFNPEKRNVTDFAVWKLSPKGTERDMEWDSPWGKGFPGWHLECSVIAREHLGDTVDIHTGGIDHLSVHHPNEIAQSKAVTGKPLARFWLHNNFVNFKDKKMAKSAGTFVSIGDIACGGVDPMAYRFFALQTHYRKEIAYSWDAIKAANQGLRNLYKAVSFYDDAGDTGCADLEKKFYEAMDDDQNTPRAMDVMNRVIGSKYPSASKLRTLLMIDKALGLRLQEERDRRRKLSDGAVALLKLRKSARGESMWAKSDELRNQLLDMGVDVQDTEEGQVAALVD